MSNEKELNVWLDHYLANEGKRYDEYRNVLFAVLKDFTEQQVTPVPLQFPTMLRKMWSGGEVQDWLNEQGPLYRAPVSSKSPEGPIYLLMPGYVHSQYDGQRHYIDAKQLARLYTVPMYLCVVYRDDGYMDLDKLSHLIQLAPRGDGNYSLTDAETRHKRKNQGEKQ